MASSAIRGAIRWAACAVCVLGGALGGCVLDRINHCLDAPNMVGCPELCLEDSEWEHCPLVDPDQFVDDAGACGTCTVSYPYCDPATTTCFECTEANGCECWRDQPCGAEAPVCVANQCEACINDTSCEAFATAPICDDASGACRGCASDDECAGMTDTPVCDETSGTCVECTVDTEATACPPAPGEDVGPACDPVAFTCTGAIRGTLGFCRECISDSECRQEAGAGVRRCVPTNFSGTFHGTFCLLDILDHRDVTGDPGALCPLRQRSEIVGETSVGGVLSNYCSPRQSLTNCEATLSLGAGCSASLPCTADGAICTDSVAGSCTYVCIGDEDCPGDINGAVVAGSCDGDAPSVCMPPP